MNTMHEQKILFVQQQSCSKIQKKIGLIVVLLNYTSYRFDGEC